MKIFIYIIILINITVICESNNTFGNSNIGICQSISFNRDEIEFKDRVYRETIKTTELYRNGWRLSLPYRNLEDTTSLILEFDDLTDQTETFTYTLIHCTSDWQPTDIPESGYLGGLPEAEIRDYRFSRNTLQPYIHYHLALPNEDMNFKLPGNYILYVYEDYDKERPVLTRRFYVIDPKVGIQADIHRTDNLNYLYSKQEVDFTIDYTMIDTDNPRRDFRVSVLQNYNWLTAITNLEPKFIHPESLVYDYEEENLFPGGSEFRHFDTKSLRFNSDRIAEIRFERPIKHVYLKPDLIRSQKSYEYEEDINGFFLVKWDDAVDSDLEADYVMVHFGLQVPKPFENLEIYLSGALTDRNLDTDAKMKYDPLTMEYRTDLLLKQGYFNYTYTVTDQDQNILDPNPVEGSFFETVNDYCIFVYYRDIRERFDRLVGLEIINSVKQPGN